MTTIKKSIDGYICEFEGENYETAESDVGFYGGFTDWNILDAVDDCGRSVDDATLRYLELKAVDDETIGDDILVKLNVAFESEAEGCDDDWEGRGL